MTSAFQASQPYLEATLEMVDLARRLIRQKMADGFEVHTKPDGTFVTDADMEAETLLRKRIVERFPDHGIVGEEFPARHPESPFQWVLDPVDGTLSFTRGIPLFGVIVSLHHEGKPVCGVIDHPGLDLRVWAGAGLGAYRNGTRISLPDLPAEVALESEIIATGDRNHFCKGGKGDAFDRLVTGHPQVRTYADCFGHTMAVSGSVGAMVDYGLRWWDFSATELLVREAGGRFVTTGSRQDEGGLRYNIIFGKPRVVDAIVTLMQEPAGT
ncbi:MAG: inositol monophosphatase family protein [Candidatus Xenobia bacterium]